jgi:hypothetical protein
MKKIILLSLSLLALSAQIHVQAREYLSGYVEWGNPWVRYIGHSQLRINGNYTTRPKAFRIRNNSGHELKLTIDYNVCQPDHVRIPGHATSQGEIIEQSPRMDAWTGGACIARRISGRINMNGNWVDVVPWNASGTQGSGAFGAQFEVNLNNQGSATVRFLRNSHVSAR